MQNYPKEIVSVEQLEDMISTPTPEVIDSLGKLTGDILILGVGGKIGPSLARMAKRAVNVAGVKKRIIGVSRFSTIDLRHSLEACDIETIQGDLLDVPLHDLLFGSESAAYLANTAYVQPAMFAIEYALADLLRHWGVEPDYLVGHSVGEITAACFWVRRCWISILN